MRRGDREQTAEMAGKQKLGKSSREETGPSAPGGSQGPCGGADRRRRRLRRPTRRRRRRGPREAEEHEKAQERRRVPMHLAGTRYG